jgi:hypothetical protein
LALIIRGSLTNDFSKIGKPEIINLKYWRKYITRMRKEFSILNYEIKIGGKNGRDIEKIL